MCLSCVFAGLEQSLGLLGRQEPLLGIVELEQPHAIGRVALGARDLLLLAQLVHRLEQGGHLVGHGQRVASGPQLLMRLRHHLGADGIQGLAAKARFDVIAQKAQGGLEVAAVQSDMRHIHLRNELAQGRHLAQGLPLQSRVLMKHHPRSELLRLQASLVKGDRLRITDLDLTLPAMVIPIPQRIHLVAFGRDGQDEAGNGRVVVVRLGSPLQADSRLANGGR